MKLFLNTYGFIAPKAYQPLELETRLFYLDYGAKPGEEQGLRAPGHFMKVADYLWPKGNPAEFVWHPWATSMLHEACYCNDLAVLGCASSGKSRFFAAWAIISWLAAPQETMVLITSTSLKDARQRIWGDVVKLWNFSEIRLPGRLIDSQGIIRTDDGTGKFDDRNGISLIPGERKHEKEAIGKLIGRKNQRVILVGDELPELSPALVEAARSNLSTNPVFQMIGIGNFKGYYDPLGAMCEPREGWKSITAESERWETKTGIAIRFDGLKSPNVTGGEDKWPILTSKKLRQLQATNGPKTLGFWRMVRSYPCPDSAEDSVYSEADLISGDAAATPVWREPPITISTLDPGFTNGGDRSIQRIIRYGVTTDGVWTIHFTERIKLEEDAELLAAGVTRSAQIANQFRVNCESRGIPPLHTAMDTTGAGAPLCDMVVEKWEPGILRVMFGGGASELPVSSEDPRTGQDAYANRVTELWFAGTQFLKYGQLRGVDPDLARELTARKYSTLKKGEHARLVVEGKDDMKVRLGFSPDDADACLIGVALLRERFGAVAGRPGQGAQRKREKADARFKACEEVYANVTYADTNCEHEPMYVEG